MSIPSGLLSSDNLDWLKQSVLNRQCSGYQIGEIFEAILTQQFQWKTDNEQHQLLQEMVLLTKNSPSAEVLTVSELVGLEPPQTNKAIRLTLKYLKLVDKLLRPYVLSTMKSEQLRDVHVVAKDIE